MTFFKKLFINYILFFFIILFIWALNINNSVLCAEQVFYLNEISYEEYERILKNSLIEYIKIQKKNNTFNRWYLNEKLIILFLKEYNLLRCDDMYKDLNEIFNDFEIFINNKRIHFELTYLCYFFNFFRGLSWCIHQFYKQTILVIYQKTFKQKFDDILNYLIKIIIKFLFGV